LNFEGVSRVWDVNSCFHLIVRRVNRKLALNRQSERLQSSILAGVILYSTRKRVPKNG
jgi:hypothetical protein